MVLDGRRTMPAEPRATIRMGREDGCWVEVAEISISRGMLEVGGHLLRAVVAALEAAVGGSVRQYYADQCVEELLSASTSTTPTRASIDIRLQLENPQKERVWVWFSVKWGQHHDGVVDQEFGVLQDLSGRHGELVLCPPKGARRPLERPGLLGVLVARPLGGRVQWRVWLQFPRPAALAAAAEPALQGSLHFALPPGATSEAQPAPSPSPSSPSRRNVKSAVVVKRPGIVKSVAKPSQRNAAHTKKLRELLRKAKRRAQHAGTEQWLTSLLANRAQADRAQADRDAKAKAQLSGWLAARTSASSSTQSSARSLLQLATPDPRLLAPATSACTRYKRYVQKVGEKAERARVAKAVRRHRARKKRESLLARKRAARTATG